MAEETTNPTAQGTKELKDMPKAIVYGLVILLVLAMIPPALIARQRAVKFASPPIHFIQDMDNQHKFRSQMENPLFVDHRSSRLPVPGTVARGELREDDHLIRGIVNQQWAITFPSHVNVNINLLERGQERFMIYCQPCHGASGYGDGMINQRAMELVNRGVNGTQWVQAKSLHETAIREQPVGQIFNSITNGVRTMPPYGSQIPVEDRWAIVAYVQALQKSQHASSDELPADMLPPMPPPTPAPQPTPQGAPQDDASQPVEEEAP
jgi:mono/diheme cytochrome c family protein